MLAQLRANGKQFRLPRAGNVVCSGFDCTLIDSERKGSHGEVIFFGDASNAIMGNVDYDFWGNPVIKDATVWAWPLESTIANVPPSDDDARAFFDAVADVKKHSPYRAVAAN